MGFLKVSIKHQILTKITMKLDLGFNKKLPLNFINNE
jgi:hypothetical protein